VIEKVWIEPKVVHTQDQLKVVVESSDKDKDFVYYTYQWEKNGTALTEEKGETLESRQFKKGDSLSVVVVADDREAVGTPKRSDPIVVSNSPPMITSSPPTSLKGNTYLYQVKAEDPDLDPVSFSLKSAPKGMAIDQTTGLLRWEIQKENEGTQVLEIEASDPDGAKSLQHYTWPSNCVSQPPSFHIRLPEVFRTHVKLLRRDDSLCICSVNSRKLL
jgi:hypothetical protein